jgi:hypothetical protein
MQTEERRQSSPHRRASCRQKQRGPWTLDRPDGQAFRTQKLEPFRSKFLGILNFTADIADSKNHLQERTNASSSSTTDSFQKVLTIFNTDSTQTPPARHLIVNERDQHSGTARLPQPENSSLQLLTHLLAHCIACCIVPASALHSQTPHPVPIYQKNPASFPQPTSQCFDPPSTRSIRQLTVVVQASLFVTVPQKRRTPFCWRSCRSCSAGCSCGGGWGKPWKISGWGRRV